MSNLDNAIMPIARALAKARLAGESVERVEMSPEAHRDLRVIIAMSAEVEFRASTLLTVKSDQSEAILGVPLTRVPGVPDPGFRLVLAPPVPTRRYF